MMSNCNDAESTIKYSKVQPIKDLWDTLFAITEEAADLLLSDETLREDPEEREERQCQFNSSLVTSVKLCIKNLEDRLVC